MRSSSCHIEVKSKDCPKSRSQLEISVEAEGGNDQVEQGIIFAEGIVNDNSKLVVIEADSSSEVYHANREGLHAIVIQCRIRGFLVRNELKVANKAAKTIQLAWRRCVVSLRMKLLQVFELLSSAEASQVTPKIPSPMKKARTLLPRNSESFNRVKDITPQLPRHHECGVFVEEILNSVTVVIQCAARRYLVKQKISKLHRAASSIQHSWREAQKKSSTDASLHNVDEGVEDEVTADEEKVSPLRFSTDSENELILAQIYQRALANADETYARLPSGDSSACLSKYINECIHASEQDTFISK